MAKLFVEYFSEETRLRRLTEAGGWRERANEDTEGKSEGINLCLHPGEVQTMRFDTVCSRDGRGWLACWFVKARKFETRGKTGLLHSCRGKVW